MVEEAALIGALAREACVQRDSEKLADLDSRVVDLRLRAESVQSETSAEVIAARAFMQEATLKMQDGLKTCDNTIWLDAAASMEQMVEMLRKVRDSVSEYGVSE